MPCPCCAGVNQRGEEAVAAIEVVDAAQDEARVYGKKPEYPVACCRDEGQGGGAFYLEDASQLASGFFISRRLLCFTFGRDVACQVSSVL